MATEHSSLLWLPDALRIAGLNVIELDGWKTNQQGYYWTHVDPADPWNLSRDTHDGYVGDPNGWTWHHTASRAYTPYVKNGSGQTKANLWMGLWYDGRLYHVHDQGVPTVVVASSGPANYSQGSNYRGMLVDFILNDRRFDGPQRHDDTPSYYGNRYTGATEIVHPGYGEPLHPGVWEAAVVTGAVLSSHYAWSAWRNHGHYDVTDRKVDPRFEKGYPYSIAPIQNEIEARLEGGTPPVEPPVEPPTEDLVQLGRNVEYCKEGQEGLVVEYWQVRIIEAVTGVKFYGNSNWNFIAAEAPELTPKVWDAAMTAYLSEWTQRNSYGVGPTEQVMIENAIAVLYND